MATTASEVKQAAGVIDPALDQRITALIEARVATEVEKRVAERVAALVPQRLSEGVRSIQKQRAAANGDGHTRRLAIVASKGSLDMAYPPLILATTAAAMGWEVAIFFTFYGLDIINRRKLPHLKVAPVGNPAMPEPIKGIPFKVPTLIGALPFMSDVATAMMKQWFAAAQIPSIQELLDVAQDTGVELISCTTTMGVMGVRDEDIIAGANYAGAGHFLDYAASADVALFV